MEIKLKQLTLTNFKGMKSYDFKPDEQSVNVYGANDAGKTTIVDAFYWLLFNKDSNNSADFGIKTLKDGKEIHNLDHSVAGTFNINGKEVELKKIYREKWVKKRGSTSKSFTGHESDYEINGAPKKKKDFDEYISSIIEDNEVFRLVTDPMYFNSLKTDDKRKILMEVAGDVDEDKIIKSNPALKDLPKHLENHTIDELKDMNKRDKRAVNQKLKEIPTRIDEINHGLQEYTFKSEDVQKEKEGAEQGLNNVQEIINNLKNGDEQAQLKRDLTDIMHERKQEYRKKESDAQSELDEYMRNFDNTIKNEVRQLKQEQDNIEFELSSKTKQADVKEGELIERKEITSKLRDQWNATNDTLKKLNVEKKEFDTKEVCECCGQNIPQDEQEAHVQAQKEKYNQDKAERIKSLNNDLKALQADGIESSGKEKELKAEVESLAEEYKALKSQLKDITSKIDTLESKVVEPTETHQYRELSSTLNTVQSDLEKVATHDGLKAIDSDYKEKFEKLQKLEHDVDSEIDEQLVEVKEFKEKIAGLNEKLSVVSQNEKAEKRIKELEKEQDTLADQYEQLEAMENMLNEFTTTKVKFIEESVSEKFEHVRFKLFDEQLNGGIDEVCVATYDGVPYDKGLNASARVKAGADIIKTLSAHYDFYAPIFFDNGESVSVLPETKSQQIKLIVSEQDKTLRMENE